MYSLQHVFWRGAMALSLFAIGGIGAGVSEVRPQADAQACVRSADAAQRAAGPREIRLVDEGAVVRLEIARPVRDEDV